MPGRWGAIFDWDGVVVDMSPQVRESYERLAAEQGLELPEGYFARTFGVKPERVLSEILGWTQDPKVLARLVARKAALFEAALERAPPRLLPGVAQLLAALKSRAIPTAVASSATRAAIERALEAHGLGQYFDAIVSAEDVARGKPDPQAFLEAAARIGIEPARCVIFEDAPVGIQAARAADMKSAAVTTNFPALVLAAADYVVPGLDAVDVEVIAGWFG